MNSTQHPITSDFSARSTAADVLENVDLGGKTAVVTGGYSGLGLETTKALAAADCRVLVPARDAAKARAALAGIDGAEVLEGFDLADLASVARTAAEISQQVEQIDMLIAAAGVMATPQRPVGPGWDYQFSINHLGHFAFVCRLFPLLERAGGARVVSYSSAGHQRSAVRWDDLHFLTGYDKWAAYGQAKTSNVLFAVQLDRLAKDRGVRAFALHPGKIITDLQRDLTNAEQVELGWVDTDGNVIGEGFKSAAQGAATGVWAATSPLLDGHGGLYLADCNVSRVADPEQGRVENDVQPYAIDAASAERLWGLSAAMTATDLPGRR